MFWITGGAGVFTALAKEKIMTRRESVGSAAAVAVNYAGIDQLAVALDSPCP